MAFVLAGFGDGCQMVEVAKQPASSELFMRACLSELGGRGEIGSNARTDVDGRIWDEGVGVGEKLVCVSH